MSKLFPNIIIFVLLISKSLICFGLPGDINWTYTTGGVITSSPAIDDDGVIYIGSTNSNLYAIYPTGDLKWVFNTSGEIHSSPSIGYDGTIYVGSNDNKLYAINPNGSKKWEFTTGGDIYSTPAIGLDGIIYIGSYDNKLYAINPSNGSKKWEITTQGNQPIHSSPIIGQNGTIFYATINGTVEEINTNGTVSWSGGVLAASPLKASFAIDSNGNIYIRMSAIGHPINIVINSYLVALSPSGSLLWEFNDYGIYTEAMGSIVINNTDVILNDNGLTSVTQYGNKNWALRNNPIYSGSTPVIGLSGQIYVGSSDKKLYALNSNGTDRWNTTLGGEVYSSPNIADDGTLYVGTNDGKLYAIETSSGGLANSSWPVFGGNKKHTNNVNSPVDFSFSPKNNEPINSLVKSESKTVTGILDNTPINISVDRGFAQFRVNGGTWKPNTSNYYINNQWNVDATIDNGDSVEVRVISHEQINQQIIATLTIGVGAAAINEDFQVTSTINSPIDSDQDNILDAWEILGFVPIDTTSNNIANFLWDFDYSEYGQSKPIVGDRDLYLWIDKAYGLDNPLKPEAIKKLKYAFSNSRNNTGKNINLHITEPTITGLKGSNWEGVLFSKEILDETNYTILNDQLVRWQNYYFYKYFDDDIGSEFKSARHAIYKYMMYGYKYKSEINDEKGNKIISDKSSGIMIKDSSITNEELIFVASGSFGKTVIKQAGTMMHELGHALGLGHGGAWYLDGYLDRTEYIPKNKNDYHPNRHRKPHYLSVMNYLYQFGLNNGKFIDFNSCKPYKNAQDLLVLDEASLDETDNFLSTIDCNIGSTQVTKIKDMKRLDYLDWSEIEAADSDINWDGSIFSVANNDLSVNINGADKKDAKEISKLTIKSDWDNISFSNTNQTALKYGIISSNNTPNSKLLNISFESINELPNIPAVQESSFYLQSKYFHRVSPPNTLVDYHITIINDGLLNDIFDIVYSSENNWIVSNLPLTQAVDAGASIQVPFTVTVPLNAINNQIDNLDITVVSQTSTLEDSFTFHTEVQQIVDSDTDGDGLTDLEEAEIGTNINETDTDNDGIDDNIDEYPLIHQDKMPDPIIIADTLDVNFGSWVESEVFTLSGINVPVKIYVVNGEYSIDGGEYSNHYQNIESGQTVQFKIRSSDSNASSVSSSIFIGDFTTTYSVVTLDKVTSTSVDSEFGKINLSLQGGGLNCGFSYAALKPQVYNDAPLHFQFKYGLIEFITSNCEPGSTMIIDLTYPDQIIDGSFMIRNTINWYEPFVNINANTVQFSIVNSTKAVDVPNSKLVTGDYFFTGGISFFNIFVFDSGFEN